MRRRAVGVVLALLIAATPGGAQEVQERQGVLERDVAQLKTFLTTP